MYFFFFNLDFTDREFSEAALMETEDFALGFLWLDFVVAGNTGKSGEQS